jgi:hypothetical protein
MGIGKQTHMMEMMEFQGRELQRQPPSRGDNTHNKKEAIERAGRWSLFFIIFFVVLLFSFLRNWTDWKRKALRYHGERSISFHLSPVRGR